jgi:hypothetical protein
MNNKYTFWELCEKYAKIEVPIIQRDYAQGRETPEVQVLRKKFVNDFLIESLLANEKIELDFVYGSILVEQEEEAKKKIFIPLDGQQRLTTLFLFHVFIAIKEGRLAEIKDTLSRFSYETRPSSHDFCKGLISLETIEDLSAIKAEIEDAVWFNEEWKDDPTVSGMLNMLHALASNSKLRDADDGLLDELLNSDDKLVSFYFTDLNEFGLTENLYIRMNARGKMLTDFENFKSEFFKIIRYNPDLLEVVKDKIEYDWVNNLWEFREEDSYVIDPPFMAYLSFITEMLYFKDAQRRAKFYESDFLKFSVLKEGYSKEENLKFLIFALDFIKDESIHDGAEVLWEGETLHSILTDILNYKRDINQTFVYFSALSYCYDKKPKTNLHDYLRVVRNLIENTADNSKREWPRLISSLQKLISDNNVYSRLLEINSEKELIGFDKAQRKEELFKAKLIQSFESSKKLVFDIEDQENLKGNITNILLATHAETEAECEDLNLEDVVYNGDFLKQLEAVFKSYEVIADDNFDMSWGDLLNTSVYKQTYYNRYIINDDYEKGLAVMFFAKKLATSKQKLPEYLLKIEKKFIKGLTKKYSDFSEIRNVNEQLYLYYIINSRIYGKGCEDFFKNGNYNIGWLAKEVGFESYFKEGIKGANYFETSNPIFQLYNLQFRYNLGINNDNTLDIETVGGNMKPDPFRLIQKWALEKE